MSRNFQHDLRYHSRGDFPSYCDWLERYVAFLRSEGIRLRSGTIGGHLLRCVLAHHQLFKETGSCHERFRTWECVQEACYWLAQLDAGGKS
jgi:hypothetical protein